MKPEPVLLDVRDVSKRFTKPRSLAAALLGAPASSVHAVRGVSFALARGETLGLVGESGCGKSTLGRCIAGFHPPTSGEVILEEQAVSGGGWARRRLARRVQMIFQDPYSSLNPRISVGEAIAEVLRVHRLRSGKGGIAARVDELLEIVGLSPTMKRWLPHSFSGGQRQRISIARALAAEPQLIIADEPVSALDVSIQAQILNLFAELRDRLGLTYLFVAHDLNVVRHISDRVAVMYLGQIVELAPARDLFQNPGHPYTRALLSAVPQPDPATRSSSVSLEGELPDPSNPPPGCGFNTRCPLAINQCRERMPELDDARRQHSVRCFRAFESA